MRYNKIARLVLVFSVLFFSLVQARVYVPLPGVSDKMDSEKIIQQLLEIKRIPITKTENENKDYKIENGILNDFYKYVDELNNRSRNLYNQKSPFREMKAVSADESALETTADRSAEKQDYKVEIIQLAQPDAFASDSLPRNQVLKPARFTVKIGEKNYPIYFRGGTVFMLANTLEEQTDGELIIRTISDTPTTVILQISGKNSGEKNKIQFSGDTQSLFDTGILTQGTQSTTEYKVDLTRAVSLNTNRLLSSPKMLVLKPGNEGEISLADNPVSILQGSRFHFNLNLTIHPTIQPDVKSSESLPDLSIGKMEGVSVSNITVEGGDLIAFYVEEEIPSPAPKPVVSNFTEIITLVFSDDSQKNMSILSNGYYTLTLGLYAGQKVQKIQFRNANTDRDYTLSDLKFITTVDEGETKPKNLISQAKDAIIAIDGVRISRDKNQISDAVTGVNLFLKRESRLPIDVSVDNDYELVSKSLVDWVNSYNQVMEYVSILTRTSMNRVPLHERDEKNFEELRDGIYQTETSFLSLKNKLRTATMNAYPTKYGMELRLLEHIGIFTKKPGSFNADSEDWKTTRMGLLKVDEDVLKSKMKTHYDGIYQLFGDFKDGQYSGVAWEVTQILKYYLSEVGFLMSKVNNNKDRIKRNEKDILKMQEALADYEEQERRKFSQMNQAISETESQKKWMNSQFKDK